MPVRTAALDALLAIRPPVDVTTFEHGLLHLSDDEILEPCLPEHAGYQPVSGEQPARQLRSTR